MNIVDNVEKELMDMQKSDQFEFAKTNLISVTMGNESEPSKLTEHCGKSPPRITMLFNANPYHIRPLASNIISNVLYGDESSQIHVTNHPLVYNKQVIRKVEKYYSLYEVILKIMYTIKRKLYSFLD